MIQSKKIIIVWIGWNCCSKIPASCPLECIKILIWSLTTHINLDYVHSKELFLIQMWSNFVERVWTIVSSTDWSIHLNCDKKPRIGSSVKIPEFLPMIKIQNTYSMYSMYILANLLCVKQEIQNYEYDTFSVVVECWVSFWSDFHSGSRVLKKVSYMK